ncbi:E3 ubiquitin-protein ligase znrf2-like isoform X2 [Acipenser ruthenus]|uniref:E3 ubiquitin-protein ligase znrf2-like isoform X2 n=1 Tax=Acipenser ruthenus TaxID=7906 RepID=UPI002740CB0C|nr:E3 ubiquitin-protein ligase znrf2-like isoform X2 [Acipenser ruthenus]
MGAKQSTGSPSANGRTRAYSGSDLPSSTSSSNDSSRTAALAMRYGHYGPSTHGASGAAAAHHLGQRTRSMGGSGGGSGPRAQALNQAGLNIPNSSGTYSSQESDNGTPEENTGERDRSSGGHGAPRLLIGSLPAHLSPHMFGGFKCPVCSKFVPSDEMDLHLVMCLTKPRITYNGKTHVSLLYSMPSKTSLIFKPVFRLFLPVRKMVIHIFIDRGCID